MSWKNTDPLDLWKTSTTLPIKKERAQPIIAEAVYGSARTRFWSSLNQMNAASRSQFFRDMLKIWPYKWEKRGIKWSISAFPMATMASSLYISTRITSDVFLVDPKMNFLECLKKTYSKSPTLMTPVLLGILSQWATYRTIYQPYIEHEGQLSKKSLFMRACFIVTVFGLGFPMLSVPPMANCAYNAEELKAGRPAYPEGSVFDMIAQTFESTRSLWRRLPIMLGAHLLVVGAAVSAMAWSRDRIHDTIDLDSELIMTLMEENERKKNEGKQSLLERFKMNAKKFTNWLGQTDFGKAGGKPIKETGDWRTANSGILEWMMGLVHGKPPEIPTMAGGVEKNIARRNKEAEN